MKENILFLYSISHLQKFSKYRLNANSKFLELLDDNMYFISFVKKQQLAKHLDFNRFKNVISGKELFDVETHKEFFKMLDEIQEEYRFTKMYLTFTCLDNSFIRGNEEKALTLYNKILNDENENRFMYTKHFYRRLCLPIHLIVKYGVRPTHLIDDPFELDYTSYYKGDNINRKLFYCNSSKPNIIHSPILEYGVNNFNTADVDKTLDFAFGFTNVMSNYTYRSIMSNDFISIIKNKEFEKNEIKYRYFCKDKQYKEELKQLNITYCDADTYNNEYILNSKFTFLIKAYDESEISFLRFTEAITRDCIPIIHSDVNISLIENILGNLYHIYNKYGLYVSSASELPAKLKLLNYEQILSEIKQTDFYKNRKDPMFYKQEIEKLKNTNIL